MQNINSIAGLREKVAQLEYEQRVQGQLLKEQLSSVLESLKPVNLIKNSLKDFVSSRDIFTNILNTGAGLAVGMLSKNLLVGPKGNPLKKLLGTILEAGIATVVTVKGYNIRDSLRHLLGRVLKKKAIQDTGLVS